LALGDHLRVRRWRGLYFHHGIDMGDGTVVHFSGEPLRQREARVIRESLASFACGCRLEVVQYRETTRSPEEVAAEALRLLDSGAYHLWRNNCEHFACYCKTGHKSSKQVARALAAAGAVAASATVVIAGVAVKYAMKRRAGTSA